MASNNTDYNAANGPSSVRPKASLGPIDKLRGLVTDSAHFLLRLYFSVLLLVYYWFAKIFLRLRQPLEPILQGMQKVPPGEATAEGIRQQLYQLLYTVLLFLAPLFNRAVAFLTRPLAWARDKVVEYVEEGGEKEKSKQTDTKAR
jgi:hypothetical protein